MNFIAKFDFYECLFSRHNSNSPNFYKKFQRCEKNLIIYARKHVYYNTQNKRLTPQFLNYETDQLAASLTFTTL